MIYATCVLGGLTVGFVLGNFQCRFLFGRPPRHDEELWRELEELRRQKKASDEVQK